ncbi:MAG: lysozyme inhibitor LprI family protein [Pseudomonadota bacterium]
MRFLFLFVLMLLVSSNASAEISAHIAYCDEADSTAALQDCVNKHHASAQERLNTAYEKVTAELEEEDLNILRDIQAQWIAYRDAECAWESSRVETEGLMKIYELSCEARMTEDRAALLEATYDNEDQDNQSELSGFPRWMNALTEDHPDVFWRFGERERLDLNCDGNEDVVMLGAAVSRVQKLEVSETEMQEDEQGRTPHAMDVVVSITENPPTGRPTSQLFRLPITETLDGPSLCSEKVSLAVITKENEEAELAEGEEVEEVLTCNQHIEIQAKQCDPVTLSWSGKDYVLNATDEDANQPQENN